MSRFTLSTKQKLAIFFVIVLAIGLIGINVFMFYYMESKRVGNENEFYLKPLRSQSNQNTTDGSTLITTANAICHHNTIWVGDKYCDDNLNTRSCNYDGGDCCLQETMLDFCTTCFCHIDESYPYYYHDHETSPVTDGLYLLQSGS